MSFSNNINSLNTAINVWNNYTSTIADDRPQILSWLSPLEPRLQHQDIQNRRVKNVGEWLLQTEEFRTWYTGIEGGEHDNAVLFCYGSPGVGKTYISSLVVDSLCDQSGGQNVAVACFYFDFAAQKEQSSTSMLGSLLKQVVSGLGEVPEEIAKAYGDQKRFLGGRGPQLPDIVKMLQTSSSEKPIFICIDALDECAAEYQVKLLDSLHEILQKSPCVRIFVTGRPHIQAGIMKRLSGRVTTIEITPRRGDVIRYLHARLNEDTNPDAMDCSLEADILKKIPEDISEIFLLVSLNIDAILQETTIHRRRQRLNSMTDGLGLGDAYGATLDRIKRQGGEKSRLGMAILMWISHAERPLKANELCHALAVEIGSPDLNTDNVPSIGTLLSCCQGLVVVDKETSIVRLIHFTLQEYLRAHPDLFSTAHSTMAETCLSYLNSQQVTAPQVILSARLHNTPFLEYSSQYWGMHAKRDLSDCAKLLALKLFNEHDNHISTEILLEAQEDPHFDYHYSGKALLFSGLHYASLFGIDEIAAELVEVEGCDINQMDSAGNTPLHWAARNGNQRAVEVLLGRDGVNPDKPNVHDQTPLCRAAENGHEGVVKILLGRDDVNPNTPDKYDQTPLRRAARNGHEGVVKLLLERDDITSDKPDKYGQTPLTLAAEGGHEGVVKTLLERHDVEPNKPDKYGQTPLCCAASRGYEGVVKMLLGRDDDNPDKLNQDYQTPLCCAALGGHEGVVNILLGRGDFESDKLDKYGQTPLCCAALHGHEGVVKILLARDGVDPDKSDKFGRTPLSLAAEDGHDGVVKILLGRDDINPNKPNQVSQTPLYYAALGGHDGVVKLLLGREDVGADKPDILGRTPLWYAALNGHNEVVKLLLGRGEVEPNKSDTSGRTPLCCAASEGHEEVVKILLERSDVNPDRPDKNGHTPLWWATEEGHEKVVRVLLRRGDINPVKRRKLG